MKKTNRIIAIIAIVAIAMIACASLVACNEKGDGGRNDIAENLTFSAPEGTPALAILRLVTDNAAIDGKSIEYKVVKPNQVALEMSSKSSDMVIMPVNAGANLIRQGADYKLVSVAVNGSLYMIGKTDDGEITLDDIKGKVVACIGQTGVPGLVFRYVMSANGIKMITDENAAIGEDEVGVRYVADGPAARVLLASGKADFAVVGEPAATQFKGALSLNAEMNMQAEYAKVSGASNYAQAGLFVRSSLANSETFMNALFDALEASKTWVTSNPGEVTAFAKEHLYETAAFPAASIARCAINATRLDDAQKADIITFLSKVMPKDSQGNAINWQEHSGKIFA